jgi:glyoxylase-like metal-dependent hydrolase (beta-lactamase superfamily II)
MRYRWRLLRAGQFKLDGGAMFGLIPRAVWSRTVPTDDKGRITVQHNCLLLDSEGPGPEGRPIRILIESGSGDKLDDKSRQVFEIGDRSVLSALAEAGADPASIDAAIVTHLHFDHAGGLTRRAREGESPEWTGPGAGGDSAVVRSFPNARVFVQAREWRDALANRSVMTRTYFRDHLEPIEPRLVLVDSPPPFCPGLTPDRAQLPDAPVERRLTETAPGVQVFLAPGHTWGQQAVMFEDVTGRRIVFTPDVMPTANHLGAAYSLAYDVEPYTSMVTRHWFLHEAAEGDWVLVLDHEPGGACFRVRRDAGWFRLEPEAE